MAEAGSVVVNVDVIENQNIDLTVTDKLFLNELQKEKENEMSHDKNKKENEMSDYENIGSKKIGRFPEIMRLNESNKKLYTPTVMVIGPLHGSGFRWSSRELKNKLAAEFIKDSGTKSEILLQEIKKQIKYLKKLFCVDLHYDYHDDDELARLFFLDGCAVLQFIHSYYHQELKKFGINNGQAALIRQDLFLFENQIPFRVLNILLNKISDSNSAKRTLFDFVVGNSIGYGALDAIEMVQFDDQNEPAHLLGLLHSLLVFGNGVNKDVDQVQYKTREMFRNVQELNSSGIKVKPSDNGRLISVSFARKSFVTAQLKLPQLMVDSFTEKKLLNLAAYEMSRDDYESNSWVVSFINLLDLLIDTEEDVKELRAERVLQNRLSTDAEVAELFNRLGSSCLTPPQDKYLYVKNELQMHYQRKSAVWVAEVITQHFRSPWTFVALIAALIAIALTAIQTVFTGIQTFHPKK